MVIRSKSSGAVNTASTIGINKKYQGRVLLRSFKGYTGNDLLFEVCKDPDTDETYIVNPKIKGGPKDVSQICAIAFFKDQFGKVQPIFFPEYTLKEKSVTGETGEELLDRSTEEWVVLPRNGDGSKRPKFDLSEPTPFEYDYSTLLDILFGDKIIENLDHPLMKKLMDREAVSAKN